MLLIKFLLKVTQYKLLLKKTRIIKILSIFTICMVAVWAFIGFSSRGYFKTTPKLTVVGNAVLADGIGSHPTSIIEAIGSTIEISHFGRKESTSNLRSSSLSENTVNVIKTKHAKIGNIVFFTDPLAGFNSKEPHYFFKTLESKIKNPIARKDQIWIAFSVWESDRIPYEWVKALNSSFDAIVVPDPFLIDVYKNSGVTKPVFVCELPVNLGDYLSLPLKKSRNSKFIFSSLGFYHPRKNQLTLVRAFSKAFKNNPDVLLYLNGRLSMNGYYKEIANEVRKLKINNVMLNNSSLSRNGYINQLLNTDCLVNPSKGEGYSISPREALALGIPCILTDNTAQSTICKHPAVKAVKTSQYSVFKLDWIEEDSAVFNGIYNECTVDDLAQSLKDMYNNYEQYLKHSGSAREWASQFQPSNLSWKYQSLLNPKAVVLGSENRVTKDEIITSSQELFNKYQNILNK